jgi:molecular chaperone HtpG
MTDIAAGETFGFQAEVKQLLHLMVHSLYSDREIFLRELISNASDANDKLRFEAIAAPELLGDDAELAIDVRIDVDGGQLFVIDNGIGMSRDEVIEQLGTIARSGTGQFLEQLSKRDRDDSRLIGQFGVGFYSSFIVADEVEILTRRAGQPESAAVAWRSDGKGEFHVESIVRPERGTQVTLKLKEDAKEFLDEHRIRGLVRKYSDHIGFPVRLLAPTGSDTEAETINQAQALWTRPRNEIDDDEYQEFYRHVSHDFSPALVWSHNRVEGKREYTSLLYVPSVAPFDIWNREAPKGVKLYVQKVFITDHATQFLPLYLRFVRGIVDSKDLSLNVSRELLQQDPNVSAIRGALTKRVLSMIEKLAANEPDKYATFWSQFGAVLKEGLAEDHANREQIAKLLRFHSSVSSGDEPDRSLSDYVAAAKEDQSSIYYLLADSPTIARASPHLEIFRDRGLEVLFLTDRIDEWLLQYLTEFDGKPLRDITRGELDLGDSADAADGEERIAKLAERVKGVLQDRVDEVRLSRRLTDSPACLVLSEQDLGFQMREMLKAAGHDSPEPVPSLELNPRHPLIRRLDQETSDTGFERLALLVLDQAALAEGRQLVDPSAYLVRLNEFLIELGLDSK